MHAKKRRRHARTHQNSFRGIVQFGVIVGIAMIITNVATSSHPARLSPLPVPEHITHVEYSGPLTLTSISESVLGAQTIDPIDFINEINKERVKVGAPPLRLSKVLMDAAKMRAEVIRKYQNFSHQDPHEGIELLTVLPKLDYHFVYASENIGMGGVSAPDFVNGFMHSTFHRENLLNPQLTETGAAIVDGPYQQYYVNFAVQLFAIPGGQDEYLGYSPSERALYEETRTSLAAKLNPIRRIIQQALRNPDYTDKHITKLSRQKEILETILARMRKNEPLENHDVALILEYNMLL